jgi:hypothetical protein
MNLRTCAFLASVLTGLVSPSARADDAPMPDPSAQPAQAVQAAPPAPGMPSAPSTPPLIDPSGKASWELIIGPFAYHWSNEDAHTHVYLLGIEREEANNFMWGFSAFQNSFGEPSAYAYYGYTWNNLWDTHFYAKLSGGIIYGYKDQYANKVPFNHDGFGLGIIPALGYRLTPNDALQIGVLGTAALIFTYNRRF